jgi:hypothetical protein
MLLSFGFKQNMSKILDRISNYSTDSSDAMSLDWSSIVYFHSFDYISVSYTVFI